MQIDTTNSSRNVRSEPPRITGYGLLRAGNASSRCRWEVLRSLAGGCRALGINPIKLGRSLGDIPRFIWTAARYAKQSDPKLSLPLTVGGLRPRLGENRESAGTIDKHYFFQDLWAARLIHRLQPGNHVDIGSRIDGFIAHLLCFTCVTVIDIRFQPLEVDGLTFVQDDATELSKIDSGSLQSVSSLHAIEHFGLGRYGDPVDPTASMRAMKSLSRVLASNGRLYFSVPLGRERLEFNAHRVFAPSTVLGAFSQLELLSFAAVTDDGRFLTDILPESLARQNYACGLFEFTKP